MANGIHVQIVRGGLKGAKNWQNRNNPWIPFDLEGADLSGCDLSGFNFESANLRHANLNDTTVTGTNFHRADISFATFHRAKASSPDIKGTFPRVEFQNVEGKGADFTSAELPHASLTSSIFTEAKFVGANLVSAQMSPVSLVGADLTECNLDGMNAAGDFERAIFVSASLRRAKITMCKMDQIDVSFADFFEVEFDRCTMREWRGAHFAKHLTTTQDRGSKYFDQCVLSWQERVCNWERIKTFGRLPLFGLSYSALVFIPILFYIIAWYNEQVDRLKAWQGAGSEWFGTHLNHLPIPSRSLVTIFSTILLAIASTLYLAYCPSRIKEFTRDVWCDQLRHPLLHYWPCDWYSRRVRLVCFVCYVVGALLAILLLLEKLIHVVLFVWGHTWGIR